MVSAITNLDLLVVGSFMTMTSAITNIDLLVQGSFMTMTSAIADLGNLYYHELGIY
jgi:hypothetical protein